MKQLRYFSLSEFDCPNESGTGKYMDSEFLLLLDKARHSADVPFVITSGGGFRTKKYNEWLVENNPLASRTSSHLLGLAADIATPNSTARYRILAALLSVGFRRIGVAKNFIHVDLDRSKPQNLIWHY